MTPKTPEERFATLEAHQETQGEKLDELKADVKAIPQQLQQFSDEIKTTFRKETRRCRRIQAQRCPAIGKRQQSSAAATTAKDAPESWGDIMKQAAVGIGILGAVIGSAYLGARDNIRTALPAPTAQAQTQTQGGSK